MRTGHATPAALDPPGVVQWLLQATLEGPSAPTPPGDWWEREAGRLSDGGLAGAALDAAAGQGAPVPAGVRAALTGRAHLDAAVRMAVEALSAPLVAMLADEGVTATVIKGPGIAWPGSTHPRPCSDLDVLVPPADFRRAVGLLEAAGGRASDQARSRRYFDRWCYEATEVVGCQGAGVDLHHHVPPWRWGAQLTAARLAATSSEADVGGVALRVASPVHNLLVASLHVLAGRVQPARTPKAWLDVAALLSACEPEEVVGEATRCGMGAITGFVLSSLPPSDRVARVVGGLPSGLAASERRRLSFVLPGGLGARHHIGQAAHLPVANAAAFLLGEAFPAPGRLQAKPGRPSGLIPWWALSLQKLRSAP